jgi:nucleoid-associated protein YgaU
MPSKYQFWLTYNGGAEKILLPAFPEVINFEKAGTNTSVSVQGLGEVVIMGDPSALVVSFESFFPAAYFPGIQVSAITKPEILAERIKQWKDGDKPVQLIITGTSVNMYCTIEEFTYHEQGGDVGSLYYSITLKEYREVSARQVKVDLPAQKAYVPPPAPVPVRADNRVMPRTYTVVKGDSLSKIAAAQLGSSSRWREIYDLNKSVIGGNPNLIHPGQVYTLPT